jgi:hypothetical protein
MHREGRQFTVESYLQGRYVATVAAKRLQGSLRKYPVFTDMFALAEKVAEDVPDVKWENFTLSEEESDIVFRALRTELSNRGDSLQDSLGRLKANSYLMALDVLNIKSMAALD